MYAPRRSIRKEFSRGERASMDAARKRCNIEQQRASSSRSNFDLIFREPFTNLFTDYIIENEKSVFFSDRVACHTIIAPPPPPPSSFSSLFEMRKRKDRRRPRDRKKPAARHSSLFLDVPKTTSRADQNSVYLRHAWVTPAANFGDRRQGSRRDGRHTKASAVRPVSRGLASLV